MRAYIALVFAPFILFAVAAPADAQTFHGYECTVDCSGHEAGYNWAEEKGITDPDDCGGNSQSFIEGCMAYAGQDGSDAYGDDDSDDDPYADNPNSDDPADDDDSDGY